MYYIYQNYILYLHQLKEFKVSEIDRTRQVYHIMLDETNFIRKTSDNVILLLLSLQMF